jgi:hypothetical protein
MSRLMADHENCGGDGDPGDGEEDSIMGVNLAEGYGTVNATPQRVKREARESAGFSCLLGLRTFEWVILWSGPAERLV